jgi:nucleoid DNA-binding protein
MIEIIQNAKLEMIEKLNDQIGIMKKSISKIINNINNHIITNVSQRNQKYNNMNR